MRAEIAKRENDMFAGLAQYQGEARFAKEIKQVITPVAAALAHHNVSPQFFLGNLVKAHTTLANEQMPAAERLAFATKLLKDYGIELGGTTSTVEESYVDPEVKALRDRVNQLESTQSTAAQRQEHEVRETLANEIKTFAEDPANSHFYDVADDIVLLQRGARAAGQAMTLKDAYDKACYLNPVVRSKLEAAATTAAIEKARKDDMERAEAAKKATRGNVKTGGHQGSGTAAAGSMEDTMAETLKAIHARSK